MSEPLSNQVNSDLGEVFDRPPRAPGRAPDDVEPLNLRPSAGAHQPRRRRPQMAVLGGLAVAAVGGAVIAGVLAHPPSGSGEAARSARTLKVVVAAAHEPAGPASATPIPVLPEHTTTPAPEPQGRITLAEPALSEPPPAPPPEPPAWSQPRRAPPVAAVRAPPLASDPDPRGVGSDGMDDPEILAADRALEQTFEDARRSGVPAGELRAERRDWRAEQAEAGSRSRRALLSAYRDRIAELRDLIEANLDDGPRDGPGYGPPPYPGFSPYER